MELNQLLNSNVARYAVMHWLDIAIVLVVSCYSFRGYRRGLSGEILQVTGLVISILIAYQFFEIIAVSMVKNMNIAPAFATIFSFLVIFFVSYIFFFLVRVFVHKIMSVTFIAGIEKAGGFIAGALRGICMLSIIFFLITMLRVPSLTDMIVNNSTMGRYIIFVAPTIYNSTFSVWDKIKSFDLNQYQMQINQDANFLDAKTD